MNHFAGHLKQHGKSYILQWKKIKRNHQHVEQLAPKTNWKIQIDSQTYFQRKIHREQGMKRKGWFKSWRVPVGEDSEYEGDYMVGDMPWVWVFWAIYWTHKSWGPTQGRQTPLDGCRAMWLTGGLWEAQTPPPGACSQGLVPKPQWRGQIVTTFVDTCFPNTAHTYTHPAYSVWPICTGAGAAMARQKAEMWET